MEMELDVSENIEIIRSEIYKHVSTFTKSLPAHIDKWRSILDDCVKPAQSLINLAEQLRHVESANIKEMEGFCEAQQQVQFLILHRSESEMLAIKNLLDKLNKTNQELKAKLVIFENSALELEWDDFSSIFLQGNAEHPPFVKLLRMGLQFCTYFDKALQNIKQTLRQLDYRDESSMNRLKTCFEISLDEENLMYLIALTQYVENVKSIV